MADRTISITDTTVNEGPDGPWLFEIKRTGDLSQTDTVSFETTQGTATDFDDFVPFFGSYTFQPGASSILFSFPLLDDDFPEGLESFTVNLTDAGGNQPGLTLESGTITIYDDENSDPDEYYAPELSTNFGEPITFSIDDLAANATDPDGDPVSVISSYDDVAANGTIVDNLDGTLTYTPNYFFVGADELVFGLEDGRGGGSVLVLSIDVDLPEIPIYNLEFGGINTDKPEGDSGFTEYVFTLERLFSSDVIGELSVPDVIRVRTDTDLLLDPEPGQGVATEGVDFVPLDILVEFGPGSNSQDIIVQVYGDNEIEPDELFDLYLNFVESGFFLPDNVLPEDAVATIQNDDQPAEIDLTLGVLETGSYGNRFEGTSDLDGEVTASFESTGTDLVLSFDGYDVSNRREVAVYLNGELLQELPAGVRGGIESYTIDITADQQQAGRNIITFSQELNNTYAWGVSDILLEVDPTIARTISITDTTVNESPDGPRLFEIKRTGDLSQTDTVSYETTQGTATDFDDFVPFFGSYTFQPGASSVFVSIPLLDDDFPEGLESFTVNLTDAGGNQPGLTLESGTITIFDDENSNPDFIQAPGVDTAFGVPVTFSLDELVANATDPDGETVTLTGFDPELIGTITENPDGTFTYTPDEFSHGEDLIFYLGDERDGFEVLVFPVRVGTPEIPVYNLEFGGINTDKPEGDTGVTEYLFTLERLFNSDAVGEREVEDTIRVRTFTEGVFMDDPAQSTATEGVDFVPLDTLVQFGPGSNSQDIIVQVYGDTEVEPDELFGLWLTFEETGFFLDDNYLPQDAVGTIQNDDAPASDAEIDLTLGVVETGSYGNRFEGTSDLDGEVTASFESTGTDLVLSFNGYDVSNGREVAVYLNGELLQELPGGVRGGIESYTIDITADQQQAGRNIITFSQELNNTYAWGVTDILLEGDPAAARTISIVDTTVNEGPDGPRLFEIKRTGDLSQTDTVSFETTQGTATDFDDFVPFFGSYTFQPGASSVFGSIPLLDDDFPEGLESFTVNLTDAGGNQPGLTLESGTITIFDDENSNPDFIQAPGVDTAFGVPVTFSLDELVANATDPDGETVTLTGFDPAFIGTITENPDGTFTYTPGEFSHGEDLIFYLGDERDGFEVLVFPVRVGTPEIPVYNLEFGGINTDKPEGDTGVTEYLFTLERLFNSDAVGEREVEDTIRVRTFTEGVFMDDPAQSTATEGVDFVPLDTLVQFGPGSNSQDIIVQVYGDTEVEPDELFGLWLTFEETGFFLDDNYLPQDAVGTIQNDDAPASDAEIDLTLGVVETGSYGNRFEGTSDLDGEVTASFESTGTDLVLSFNGYDVSNGREVAVYLNGELLQELPAGVRGGIESYTIDITADQQQAGQNIITFSQELNNTYAWGVTDILLEGDGVVPSTADVSLIPGVLVTETFGNKFDGNLEPDGQFTAGFQGTGSDLIFDFSGYDIDFANEIELLLNGESLLLLDAGLDRDYVDYSVEIAAEDQISGENILTFAQIQNTNWQWGFTDLLLSAADEFVL